MSDNIKSVGLEIGGGKIGIGHEHEYNGAPLVDEETGEATQNQTGTKYVEVNGQYAFDIANFTAFAESRNYLTLNVGLSTTFGASQPFNELEAFKGVDGEFNLNNFGLSVTGGYRFNSQNPFYVGANFGLVGRNYYKNAQAFINSEAGNNSGNAVALKSGHTLELSAYAGYRLNDHVSLQANYTENFRGGLRYFNANENGDSSYLPKSHPANENWLLGFSAMYTFGAKRAGAPVSSDLNFMTLEQAQTQADAFVVKLKEKSPSSCGFELVRIQVLANSSYKDPTRTGTTDANTTSEAPQLSLPRLNSPNLVPESVYLAGSEASSPTPLYAVLMQRPYSTDGASAPTDNIATPWQIKNNEGNFVYGSVMDYVECQVPPTPPASPASDSPAGSK